LDIAEEKRKILDGTYPTKVVAGRQRKHILGTREFAQNLQKMQNQEPKSRPAILIADAKTLVDKFKGTGYIYMHPSSAEYPREEINAGYVIGKSWYKKGNKYIDTSEFEIIYSKDGVHVIPINSWKNKKGTVI